MKKLFFLPLFLLIFSASNSEGISFFHGTLEEAKTLAKKENKLLFIDCYTTWCGPCKSLAKFVFTDPELGTYFNETFISIKLDMEAEGRMFAIEYGISAYPTLLFIDHQGTVKKKIIGGRDPKTLIQEGKNASLPDENYIKRLTERFVEGEKQPEFLKTYITLLSKSNKSFEVPLREYIFQTKKDVKSDSNFAAFIFDITNHINSVGMQILQENKSYYHQQFGRDVYENKLFNISTYSSKDAIKNKDEQAFKRANAFLKSLSVADKNKQYDYLNLLWLENVPSWLDYSKNLNIYLQRYLKNDSIESLRLLKSFERKTPLANSFAPIEKASRKLANTYSSFEYSFLYAKVLFKSGKIKEVTAMLPSLKEKADDTQLMEVEELIQKINNLPAKPIKESAINH